MKTSITYNVFGITYGQVFGFIRYTLYIIRTTIPGALRG